ncbi:MAG: hypothetical protein U1E59_00400, partial [Amaricoccus sp.]
PGIGCERSGGKRLEVARGALAPFAARAARPSKPLRVPCASFLRQDVDPSVRTFGLQRATAEAALAERVANDPDPHIFRPAPVIDKALLPPSPEELDAAEDARRRADMEEFLAMSGVSERPAAGTAGLSGAT